LEGIANEYERILPWRLSDVEIESLYWYKRFDSRACYKSQSSPPIAMLSMWVDARYHN
jgi:hypothetical protein